MAKDPCSTRIGAAKGANKTAYDGGFSGKIVMRSLTDQPGRQGKTLDEHFAEIDARLAAIRLNVMRFDSHGGAPPLTRPHAPGATTGAGPAPDSEPPLGLSCTSSRAPS